MIKSNHAFTLVEIIIVIVVVAILASFAILNYMRAVVKADERTAIANLSVIRSTARMYLANTGDTVIPNMGDIDAINTTLRISIIDSKIAYECLIDGSSGIRYCQASHPGGWALRFLSSLFATDGRIYCSTSGANACPSCPVWPGSCG